MKRALWWVGLLALAGCPRPKDEASVRTPRVVAPRTPEAPAVEDAGADIGLSSMAPDFFGDGHRRRRHDPADMCEPVRENLDRAARAILAPRADAAVAARPWDGRTAPKYMDLVDRRYALTAAEKALLAKNGFAVLERVTWNTYAHALHDVYQSELPIYVSADAILHAVYASNDKILADLETELAPSLEAMLARMHEALGPYRAELPPEVAADVDLYLGVARALASGAPASTPEATRLAARATAATGGLAQESLFGRPRVVDWSQYQPRGHYAKDEALQRFFRTSMWLSRLEFNLVSRGSRSSQPGIVPNPEETPREAVDALALAELVVRAKVEGELARFEKLWTQFAGRREDVSLVDLSALAKKAGIGRLAVPDSAEKLKAAIGSAYPRTARFHYMPQGSATLPAITTMLGPRVAPDVQAETDLVHGAVPDRAMPSFADVAFLLGHDHARTWLEKDLRAYPSLLPMLEKGRAIVAAPPGPDLYTTWLSALRGLSVMPTGNVPSFTKTEAFADLRVNSTVTAYGQLRHNYVLIAAQPYDEGGCEVPDGYVEPALAVYEGLAAYAQRGAEAMKTLGASPEPFERLERTMKVVLAITRNELAGRAPSEEEKRWLSMVVEILPPSSDGPGSYDGWYFDLFPTVRDAFEEHAFVADWFTSSNANAVVYAGATAPRMGLFVVDVGGEPRMAVGPVARGYQHVGSLSKRLDDASAQKLRARDEPWAKSYTAAAPKDPPLTLLLLDTEGSKMRLAVRSPGALGPVRVELLGHHNQPFASATMNVSAGWSTVVVPVPGDEWAATIRVRRGDWSHEFSNAYGMVNESIGGLPTLEWEQLEAVKQRLRPPPSASDGSR